MKVTYLKGKLHRATVTGADLNYEGSIALGPDLIKAANFKKFEKIEIYNINNGNRFSTYVIVGKPSEVCLNGAASRLVHAGDQVIICAYCDLEEHELENHRARIVLLGPKNEITQQKDDPIF